VNDKLEMMWQEVAVAYTKILALVSNIDFVGYLATPFSTVWVISITLKNDCD
jgi:hypothetical protein